MQALGGWCDPNEMDYEVDITDLIRRCEKAFGVLSVTEQKM